MAPANNTYAMAMGPGMTRRSGLRTLSDLAKFAEANPGQATVCLETEFASRTDGWPGMIAKCGFTVPPNVHVMGTGAVCPSTAAGQPCAFGEVFTTDGRIQALHLTALDVRGRQGLAAAQRVRQQRPVGGSRVRTAQVQTRCQVIRSCSSRAWSSALQPSS